MDRATLATLAASGASEGASIFIDKGFGRLRKPVKRLNFLAAGNASAAHGGEDRGCGCGACGVGNREGGVSEEASSSPVV